MIDTQFDNAIRRTAQALGVNPDAFLARLQQEIEGKGFKPYYEERQEGNFIVEYFHPSHDAEKVESTRWQTDAAFQQINSRIVAITLHNEDTRVGIVITFENGTKMYSYLDVYERPDGLSQLSININDIPFWP